MVNFKQYLKETVGYGAGKLKNSIQLIRIDNQQKEIINKGTNVNYNYEANTKVFKLIVKVPPDYKRTFDFINKKDLMDFIKTNIKNGKI